MEYSTSSPSKGAHRFGSIAISRQYVTLEQVQQALAEQIEDNVNGRGHRLLGEILREHNWITEEQMKSILNDMCGKEMNRP